MNSLTDNILQRRVWIHTEIDHKTGCAVWQRGCNNGYPTLRFNGKRTFVARFVYMLAVSDIPPNHHVVHNCGNQLCVNPRHLILRNVNPL